MVILTSREGRGASDETINHTVVIDASQKLLWTVWSNSPCDYAVTRFSLVLRMGSPSPE